jgi:SAM-dependent methyltransferase
VAKWQCAVEDLGSVMSSTTLICRGCGHHDLDPIVDFGPMPLANSLLRIEDLTEPEERFPLALFFCPSCTLVQIGESVIPQRLFGHYLYASSFSDTMLAHARALVAALCERRRLDERSLVVEIASNDGYLLQYYRQRGIPILGIEPAANLAALAERERGVPTLIEFFGADLGTRLAAEGRRADVIHAHNVFAHVPNPNDFLRGLARVLKPEGVAIIEVPYLGELISNVEFDTIYHEHFSYFSLTAIDILCRRQALEIAGVDQVPIHGGSVRLEIVHRGAAPVSPAVGEMLMAEARAGIAGRDYYTDFADRIRQLEFDLTGLLARLKAEGRRIAAYGASAKGSTLMNAFGIGAELDFVVDRSILKQGRFTPGNHLQILSPLALVDRRPDYVLLLTWNFADEILAQQQSYRDIGGRFIVPLPEVKVI